MKDNLEDLMEIRINNLVNHENPNLYYQVLYQDIRAMKPIITMNYFLRRLDDEWKKYNLGASNK